MSLDFEISILLAELKDDPRFEKATSTSPILTDTGLENDPLISGVSGNTPLLGTLSINTPEFLDIRLDLFSVRTEKTLSTIGASDVFELLVQYRRSIKEKAKVKETHTSFVTTDKKEQLTVDISKALDLRKGHIQDKLLLKQQIEFLKGKTEFPYDVVYLAQFVDRLPRKKTLSIATLNASNIDVILKSPRRPKERVEAVDTALVVKLGRLLLAQSFFKTSDDDFRKVAKEASNKITVNTKIEPFEVTQIKSEKTNLIDIPTVVKLGRLIVAQTFFKRPEDDEFKKVSKIKESLSKVSTKLDHFDVTKEVLEKTDLTDTPLAVKLKTLATFFKRPEDEETRKTVKNRKVLAQLKAVINNKNVEKEKLDKGQAKDRLILPILKPQISNDTAKFIEKIQKQFNLNNALVNAELKSRATFKPNIVKQSIANPKDSILDGKPQKARVAFDRLFITEDLQFDRDDKVLSRAVLKSIPEKHAISVQLSNYNAKDQVINVSDIRIAFDSGKVTVFSKKKPLKRLDNQAKSKSKVRKLAKKPVNQNTKTSDTSIVALSETLTSFWRVKEDTTKLLAGKNPLPSKVDANTRLIKKKTELAPFLDTKNLRDVLVSVNNAELPIERLTSSDSLAPFARKRLTTESNITAEVYEKVLNRELSTEIINTSIKGVAFMREESYTTGAYFLEPYVVVPPGRSRQF